MAKPGRLGPAQKGTLMDFFNELSMFCIIFEKKNHRISCPEYIKDLDKCDKLQKRQCQGQIHIGSHLTDRFRKYENFPEKYRKFSKFRSFLEECQRRSGMSGHSTSPPCGNLVDGLPHDCYTKTIAKLARLGPAKNGTTLENFIELSMF